MWTVSALFTAPVKNRQHSLEEQTGWVDCAKYTVSVPQAAAAAKRPPLPKLSKQSLLKNYKNKRFWNFIMQMFAN